MEHIVQFGINIDDSAIAEMVERGAYDDVVKRLTMEARDSLPKRFTGYEYKVDWRAIVYAQVRALIDERSDEIVDMAVARVYKSLTSRKAFREAREKMDAAFGGIGGEDGEA